MEGRKEAAFDIFDFFSPKLCVHWGAVMVCKLCVCV